MTFPAFSFAERSACAGKFARQNKVFIVAAKLMAVPLPMHNAMPQLKNLSNDILRLTMQATIGELDDIISFLYFCMTILMWSTLPLIFIGVCIQQVCWDLMDKRSTKRECYVEERILGYAHIDGFPLDHIVRDNKRLHMQRFL